MPVYLAEECCGTGDDLVFPNITSCVAVVALDDTGMIGGAHLTVGSGKATIGAIGRFVQASLPGQAIAELRVVGMLTEWRNNADTMFPAGMKRTLASSFGYSGIIRYLDLVKYKKNFKLAGEKGIVVHAYTKDKAGGKRLKLEYGGPNDYDRGTRVTAPQNVFSARTRTDMAPANATSNFDRTKVAPVLQYTEYPVSGVLTRIRKDDYKAL
jgi:hypothetical protein